MASEKQEDKPRIDKDELHAEKGKDPGERKEEHRESGKSEIETAKEEDRMHRKGLFPSPVLKSDTNTTKGDDRASEQVQKNTHADQAGEDADARTFLEASFSGTISELLWTGHRRCCASTTS